jgi:hypothetical protein
MKPDKLKWDLDIKLSEMKNKPKENYMKFASGRRTTAVPS